tara:strand:+ start:351 stop:1097 length:747 start_codon:yes stop_codon:yes gene_type:complete
MVLSRGLVISLGVSALGCTLLFLYFRNKITAVEKKVDIMFDLIQNHQSQQQQMNMQEAVHMNSRQEVEESDDNEPRQVTGVWSENVKSDPELIQVSDDEEDDDDDDDDDSEEVSDTDDEDDEEEEIPKLSLAKTEDMTLEVNDVKKIVVQESKPENTNIELDEPEDVTDSLDEIEVDEDDEEDEEEDEEDEEDEDGVNKEVTIEKLDDEFDYNKLKVSELKAIAKQKGLEGYKSLKKGPLVELLKSSE